MKRLARQRLRREEAAARGGRELRAYTCRVVEESAKQVTAAVHEGTGQVTAAVRGGTEQVVATVREGTEQATAAVHERADRLEAVVDAVSGGVSAFQEWFGEPPSPGDSTDVQIKKLEAQIQTMRGRSIVLSSASGAL